jgi:hypothetical protein
MITKDLLAELFVYEPETGIVRNKIDRHYNAKAGEIAGHVGNNGYFIIKIHQKAYRRAHIAFCLTYGRWPRMIDHKNHDRADDRLFNLRESSYSENAFNRHYPVSFPRGVRPVGNRFMARIMQNRKSVYLGCFATPEEAAEVYDKASVKLFGKDGLL